MRSRPAKVLEMVVSRPNLAVFVLMEVFVNDADRPPGILPAARPPAILPAVRPPAMFPAARPPAICPAKAVEETTSVRIKVTKVGADRFISVLLVDNPFAGGSSGANCVSPLFSPELLISIAMASLSTSMPKFRKTEEGT
jgi:hypothetical protein